MKRSCSTCKFGISYINGKDKIIYYECRYNPPVGAIGRGYVNQFPRLQEYDWCYKYKKLSHSTK